VGDYCEDENEILGSTKGGGFLGWLSGYYIEGPCRVELYGYRSVPVKG
jgi:hypothetical protein